MRAALLAALLLVVGLAPDASAACAGHDDGSSCTGVWWTGALDEVCAGHARYGADGLTCTGQYADL